MSEIQIKNKFYTRKCIVTNSIVNVENLIRFSFDKENKIIKLDLNKTKKGRGAYLLYSPENWMKLKKTKSFNRVFKFNFSSETYLKLEQELLEVVYEQKEQQN